MTNTYLITGGTGSLGQVLVQKLLDRGAQSIRVYSRHELDHWGMKRRLNDSRVRYQIGDIRDRERLTRAMNGVDFVIHTAALKHVDICEYNPIETIKTNVLGTSNVIEAAIDSGVKKVIGISSDKAVHPVNIYGATKLVMEKLMVNANVYGDTMFSCVRMGNFMGSNGSFLHQILKRAEGEPITVTDKDMTRFWMTLDEAANFTLSMMEIMSGGEIFVPRIPEKALMEVVKTLAPDAEIKVIGKRPGEKLHELLFSAEENPADMKDYWVIR